MSHKYNRIFFSTLIAAPLLLLPACSGNHSPDSLQSSSSSVAQSEFSAHLLPVNRRFTNAENSGGSATALINGDHVEYSIVGSGLDSISTYRIRIHQGDRCPTENLDDANRDGVIDSREAGSAYGAAILDLGTGTHAVSSTINYRSRGDYIAPQALNHRIVVVYGILSSRPSVSLPALCGRLELVAAPSATGTSTSTSTSTGTSTGTGSQQGQGQDQQQQQML